MDCAFAASEDYIVTNDNDFNILKTIPLLALKVVSVSKFKDVLIAEGIL